MKKITTNKQTKKKKTPENFFSEVFPDKTAPTYSPTLYRSTIGVSELNFSVRNGKRWNLTAKTTLISYIVISHKQYQEPYAILSLLLPTYNSKSTPTGRESLGQLVMLGFDVTVFTPASYQRHRL